jgi:hypothetical protein
MGFDLTGLNPKNIKCKRPSEEIFKTDQDKYFDLLEKFQDQKGTYFRNNVWWWRPLADYVLRFTKVIEPKNQKTWQYNDSSVISKQDAEMISQQLDHLIKTGHTKKYKTEYEARRKTLEIHNKKVMKELKDFEREVCFKLDKKNLAPADFPKKDHQMWNTIYKKRNIDADYPFSVDNVKEFSEFCKYSGGFTIG